MTMYHCTLGLNIHTALGAGMTPFGFDSQKNLKEESAAALEKLKAELEAGHQVAVDQLRAAWSRDKEAEIQQRVEAQFATEKAAWEEELRQVRLPPIQTLLHFAAEMMSCHALTFSRRRCRRSRHGS